MGKSMKRMIINAAQELLGKAGFEVRRKPVADDFLLYKEIFPEESLVNRNFYTVSAGGHLGFGTNFEHPFWTNLDLHRPIAEGLRQFNPETDVHYDLLDMSPLPIADSSAEIIFSQYTIEHVPDQAACFFFRDALRALKPNGILKVVTPNTVLDVLAYRNRDASYFHWNNWKSVDGIYQSLGYKSPLTEASLEQIFVSHFAANAASIHAGGNPNPMSDQEVRDVMNDLSMEDALNHITARCCPEIQRKYRENHISWWSPSKLVRELKRAGFRSVHTVAPCQSRSRILRNPAHFDKLWNDVATFVEAVK